MADTKTTSGGLNFTYPAKGRANFSSLFDVLFAKISSHDHEGSGKGKQLTGNALQDASISASKLQFDNDQYLAATDNAGSGTVNIVKVNASDLIEFGTTITSIVTNALRISNNTYITARNNADSGNVNLLRANTSDNLEFGADVDVLNLSNDTFLTARNNADSADIDIVKVNTSDQVELGTNLIIKSAQANVAGWFSNLGLSLSAGVLTLHSSDGTALSTSNPAAITLPDKTNPGYLNTYQLTSNQTLDETDLTGNTFGSTAATAWATDCPFYLYAVVSDDESSVQFMISRVPNLKTAPVESLIGAPDDAVADEEYAMFSLANITEGDFDGNPCICLGAFRMQKDSSDDWTIQTLSLEDGLGKFHDSTLFTYPQGQNGADLGYLANNGGTAPGWSSVAYSYSIKKDGLVDVYVKMNGNVATDGSGAVATLMSLPTARQDSIETRGHHFFFRAATTIAGDAFGIVDTSQASASDQQVGFNWINSGTIASITNGYFTDGDRFMEGKLSYQVKTS